MIVLNLENLSLFFLSILLSFLITWGASSFFANRRSITNLMFLFFCLVTTTWAGVNYIHNSLFYLFNPQFTFFLIRFNLFLAVWLSFFFFSFFYFYPLEKIEIPRWYKFYLLPFIILVSFLSLTPLVLKSIKEISLEGYISKIENGPLILLFGMTNIMLILSGIYILFKKYKQAEAVNKRDYIYVLLGFVITFSLIIIFNFIFPAFFNNPYFIKWVGAFFFPFIGITSYVLSGGRFINLKIAFIVLLISLISVTLLLEIITTKERLINIFKFIEFLFFVFIGLLLLRGVYQEVAQREKLEQLNKQLEELNRIKSEFLSFASHQVKAPMAVAKGYASIIENQIDNVPPEAKEFAHKIREAVNNLVVLIDEFLDYRRIDEGKLEFNFEKLNIVSLVKEIFENLRKLAEDKKLEYSFETNVNEVYANVDKLRFSQVIQNLIDNAIKYTPQGFVKINILKENNDLIIKVSDSGLGMSQELQKKLFGQFVRDPSIKKEIKGTGLGLYIAKYIIDNHKGQIWAESEGEGKGSTFYVKIPILQN